MSAVRKVRHGARPHHPSDRERFAERGGMIAGVAELVDARHSKCRSQKECRFDSDRPHQSIHRRDQDASHRRAGASHRALHCELDASSSLRNTIHLSTCFSGATPWSSALTQRDQQPNCCFTHRANGSAIFPLDAKQADDLRYLARAYFFLD